MGRHQSRRRRTFRPVVGLRAGVVVLLGVAIGLGFRGLDVNLGGSGGDSGPSPRAVTPTMTPCATSLRIMTASSFAPVLSRLAPALESAENCVRLEIEVVDGRAAAARVAELGAAVWIPDDMAWAAAAGSTTLAETPAAGSGTVVATSPIFMVTDAATGDRVRQAGGGWLGLANLVAGGSGVRLVARDPGGSGDGLLGVGAVGEAVWIDQGMNASSETLANTVPAARTVQDHALPKAAGEVGLVAEYALIPLLSGNDSTSDASVRESTLLTGSDHSAVLRYTWLPTAEAAANPALAAPLARVLSALTGPEGTKALASAGLRRADLAAVPNAPTQLPALSARPFDVLGKHHVEHVFAGWYAEERRSNMLVVVDVSGSMRHPVPGSDKPLIDLVRDGVTTLSQLLPDSSEVSLWKFGSLLDPAAQTDHQVLLAPAPLGAEHRQRFLDATAALTWQVTGTGLHDTILAAYTSARDSYRKGLPNHVVLFTDGRNQDDLNSITVDQLSRAIGAALDPQRPVNLSVILFGHEAEAAVLKKALEPVSAHVESLSNASAVRPAFIHAAAGGTH
jgi:Bacterial extracellular solute-binding protein/von Willebrand factor type A domain